MKIKNILVNSFGKLNKKEIDFVDGINIIYGKNESGKSTLLEFIVDMFYNISTDKARKTIADSEKYKPWNSEEYSGKLGYKLDNGREYEIFRNFNKKNDVMLYDENKEEISKTFNIDKKIGSIFFTDQTKLDKRSFLSSVVSKQESVKLNEDSQKDVIQRIINLASTGDDNISYDKVRLELTKRAKEEVGSKDTRIQPINIIENEIIELEKEKNELEKYIDKKYELEKVDNEIKGNINDAIIYNEFVQNVKKFKDDCNLYDERAKEYIKQYQDNEKEITNLREQKNNIESDLKNQKDNNEKENKEIIFLNKYKQIIDIENKEKEKINLLKEQQRDIYNKIDSLIMSKNSVIEEKEKKKNVINDLNQEVENSKKYIGIIASLLGIIFVIVGVIVGSLRILKILGILMLVFGSLIYFVENNKIKKQEKNKQNVKNQLLKIEEEYEIAISNLDMKIKLYENEINEIEDKTEKISKENIKNYSQEKDNIINNAYLEIDKGLVDYFVMKENVDVELERLIKQNNETKLEINKNEIIYSDVSNRIGKNLKIKEELSFKVEEISKKINEEKKIIIEKYRDEIKKEKLEEIIDLKEINDYAIKVKNELDTIKLKSKEIQLDKENILPKLDNLVNVEEKLEVLNSRKEELLYYRKCIELAMECLDRAYKKMKNSVTPEFSKELSENIAKITDNKYKNVRINEQDGLTVELENGMYDSANKLSCGTIEQLYLSLRIAILNQITEENMPIILDESFAYFDDIRLENMLKYIGSEFSNKQVLIFTCSNREIEILNKNEIVYNLIKL